MDVVRVFSFSDCMGKNAVLPDWHPCQMNRGPPHSVTSLAVEASVWFSWLMCKFSVAAAILHKAAATQSY